MLLYKFLIHKKIRKMFEDADASKLQKYEGTSNF